MNSTVMPPLVQEPMFDFRADEARKEAHDLIDSLTDYDVSRGLRLSFTGYPSFTQTKGADSVEVEINVGTSSKPCKRSVTKYIYKGCINTNIGSDDEERTQLFCPHCGKPLVRNGTVTTTLKDIPSGASYADMEILRHRWLCKDKNCHYCWTEPIEFKDQDHLLTINLVRFICGLLQQGLSMKEIAGITGVDKNTIKAIDKRRLEELYTIDGKQLKKPAEYSEFIGIDEFLLHKGHKYATVIIDLKTGYVLYLAHGKKKQTVYEFMDFVGDDWMRHVKAVACDMNSDYEEAFKDKYSEVKIVFDHFHIVKNFNDKVVSEVRKDEQKRLIAEGNTEAAALLKGSKYILMTTAETRRQKEKDAEAEKVISRGAELFKKPETVQKPGIEERYQKLLEENSLLLTMDLVKEMVNKAYQARTERGMQIFINRAIRTCRETGNKHFEWFANLLESHMDGIIAHATMALSSGKVEGTNNMIKTLRRKGYGYPDDDYFFLKIMDSSRKFSGAQA
ncbi:MAG: ISL3 family transposase [Erysipelotrichaceae bacterium]|jgi:transposase